MQLLRSILLLLELTSATVFERCSICHLRCKGMEEIERLQAIQAEATSNPNLTELKEVSRKMCTSFVGAIAGLLPSYTVISGDASIRHQRLVFPLLDGLKQLGVFAESSRLDGHAPIIVRGPLLGGTAIVSGTDSQPISGLLIAASFAKGKTVIKVRNPGEKAWIDLTLSWFDRLGLSYNKDHDYKNYIIPGQAVYPGFRYTVPGDFSSCAYPLVAAIITNSEVRLSNVDMSDIQGDKEIVNVLISMGAKIDIDEVNNSLTVKKGSRLVGQRIDINNFADSITILAVLGCFAEGKTEIVNAFVARDKESNRIKSIVAELKKMGGKIEEREDGLIVEKSKLKGAVLETYQDHRMVMSLSVAALAAEGESIITGVDSVKKSYPNFLEDMKKLGVSVQKFPYSEIERFCAEM